MTTITEKLKSTIVKEYIAGKPNGTTLRSLQSKYGVDYRTIGGWVTKAKASKAPAKAKEPVMLDDLKDFMIKMSRAYGLTVRIKAKKNGVTKVTLSNL